MATHLSSSATSSSQSQSESECSETMRPKSWVGYSLAEDKQDQAQKQKPVHEHESTLPPSSEHIVDHNMLSSRAYQVEMFEESLRQNVIVAMDTGSGKTQVAVLRIQAELEHSPAGKIVWFLVPSVALCNQQLEVLKSQVPGVLIKSLNGNDNIDTWTETSVWEAFLKNVSIVVSTYQVLLDAISHAFVRMDRLSLIVIDEAHNCVGRNPGSKIMARYHEVKSAGLPVPAILGLTASPVVKSSVDALSLLEKTLGAVCKTPLKHKTELLSHANRPVLSFVPYEPPSPFEDQGFHTTTMSNLQDVYHGLDISQDPYIKRLSAENTEKSRRDLRKAFQKSSTRVIEQVKGFIQKAEHIRGELGGWAADNFISTAIAQYLDSVAKNDIWFAAWDQAEKLYLAAALQKVDLTRLSSFEDSQISSKVSVLIRELLSCQGRVSGIIFVRQTVTVYMLRYLLSIHPELGERFRFGGLVGESRYGGRRRDVGELNKDDSFANLDKFRAGDLDILIATNALEEGIDVPACNLVISFDAADNLKSFIQRRGRARMQESRFLLFHDGKSTKHEKLQQLEEAMKQKYEDELREVEELDELDRMDESYVAPFCIASTGARLDLDQAKPHLEHFCAVLAAKEYVDWSPYYMFREFKHAQSQMPQVVATVVLPNTLPAHLRRIDSANAWYSERNASKDAAFQAYVALYKEGLVNDNLMPLKDEELLGGFETRAPIVDVSERWNPWPKIAAAWLGPERSWRSLCVLGQDEKPLCRFDVCLPTPIPRISRFNIFWNENPWKVVFDTETRTTDADTIWEDQALALIRLAYGHRFEVSRTNKYIIQICSDVLLDCEGTLECTERLATMYSGQSPCVIRGGPYDGLYLYEGWLPTLSALELEQRLKRIHLPEYPADIPWLNLKKWPRRSDFLHPVYNDPKLDTKTSVGPYKHMLPASCCRIDTNDVVNIQFGSLIPSITHVLEIHLVASELSTTILKRLEFRDLSLIREAISAPQAREASNYERLEFLGDCLLKFLTTVNVAKNHPSWPEGYLSKKKDRVVSNSRLCRATITTGLDRFILTEPFTGKKWRPLYVEDLLPLNSESSNSQTRQLSTKTLADVVEALIAASYLDGGMAKALDCVRLFIPEVPWHAIDGCRDILYSLRQVESQLPQPETMLEQLIGYTFQNKTLLTEAVTHASYNVGRAGATMERLEFLGDAILDTVVVDELWKRNLPHWDMHLLRTACVNADLLGFMVMEWSIPIETMNVVRDADGKPIPVTATEVKPFWKFMRYSSMAIGAISEATEQRHKEQREPIMDAIYHSTTYPWAPLAHLNIPKFFSDMFEAVLGAVWMDLGSMDRCREFVERAGVLPYLRHLLDQHVNVLHPKNKLGELVQLYREKLEFYVKGKVEYDVEAGAGAGGSRYTCKVLVDGHVVVEVEGGVNKEEVMTKAAERACEVLEHIHEK